MNSRRLRLGERAPDFETRDWRGEPIALYTTDSAGTQPHLTLLSFFRYASCPLCNLRVQELIRAHDTLAARGIRLLALFQSPAERIAHYVGRQSPPFPLIPDPGLTLYRRYGVEASWLGFARAWTLGLPQVYKAVVANRFLPGSVENQITRIPADFLIAADGTLTDLYYGRDIGDHIPLARVLAAAS